ncbi:unnamed protein product [Caenorhabditis auriculariae]|uniref:Bestrophin homolog n=1 Tax=Caenorhabditis auriculariae TaxID=2777116 RepID=A0A8S1GVA2_9PELO|nr:unnamed protein product [Caenorhabditis auriculariae]
MPIQTDQINDKDVQINVDMNGTSEGARGSTTIPKPEIFKRKPLSYNYNYDLATSQGSTVMKMLFKWRGSLWQAVYKELIIWLIGYTIVSVCYRCFMSEDQQDYFERFGKYCDERMDYLPLNFVLGFFCNIIIRRWLKLFTCLGSIDNIALFVSGNVRGDEERARQIRRNIVRYCVLSQTLVFRDIHVAVRRRFPTLESVAAAGIMLPHELEEFNSIKSRYSKYWMSFNWTMELLNIAKKEKFIDGDNARNAIAQEISKFRASLTIVSMYDWVPIPLMYPQLVNMAVHTYFFLCVFTRQFFITEGAKNKTDIDLIVPFMTIIEFIFYVGWLKVAMELLNPCGEDADDFDCNLLIDRNLAIGLASVDGAFGNVPEIKPDVFNGTSVKPLDSDDTRSLKFHLGSAARMEEITEEEEERKLMKKLGKKKNPIKSFIKSFRRRKPNLTMSSSF